MYVRGNLLTYVRGLLEKRSNRTIIAFTLLESRDTRRQKDVSSSAAHNAPRLSTSLFYASTVRLCNAAELLVNVGTWKRIVRRMEKKRCNGRGRWYGHCVGAETRTTGSMTTSLATAATRARSVLRASGRA